MLCNVRFCVRPPLLHREGHDSCEARRLRPLVIEAGRIPHGPTRGRRRSFRLPLAALIVVLACVGPAFAGSAGFSLDLDRVVPPAVLKDPPAQTEQGAQAPVEPAQDQSSPPPKILDQPRSFPVRLYHDVPSLFTAPVHWQKPDWTRFGAGVLIVGAVSLADEPVNRWIDRRHNAGATTAANDIRPLGQEGGLALLGAAWLGGHLAHNSELEAIGVDGVEASILNALLVEPLKLVFGRVRPRDTNNHGSFFAGGSSFPSGEASQAFTVAAVVAAHSHRTWVKAVAYSLAGLVGAERMQLDAHWLSDVVAGAFIGDAVGHWVVAHNRRGVESGHHLAVTPMIGAHEYGVAMNLEF